MVDLVSNALETVDRIFQLSLAISSRRDMFRANIEKRHARNFSRQKIGIMREAKREFHEITVAEHTLDGGSNPAAKFRAALDAPLNCHRECCAFARRKSQKSCQPGRARPTNITEEH